ncbi:MAG: DUF433 domain-containing protein [Gammaproteobacteria bacterium]|nr:DUF433 domain-containing protein [Gammaproteobacteria bacterium]MDE0302395.1 DUF433 domain-containing protein [Gammaproteobacteria bacterium]MDE0611517.1 DUF433 domain-containing protein [Gammaproteobacteria bacterium]
MFRPVISKDTDILGGTPVFSGTRVPVRILMEYLEAGDSINEFLDNHPTVSRSQVVEVLNRAKQVLAEVSQ